MLVLSLLQWHACGPLESCCCHLALVEFGTGMEICVALPSWPYNAYRIISHHSTFISRSTISTSLCTVQYSWNLAWGPCDSIIRLIISSSKALPQVMACGDT